MMAGRWIFLVAGCVVLTGCGQSIGPGSSADSGSGSGSSDITTGSILPSLPSASSLIPTASSLVPSWASGSKPQGPERISGNLYRIPPADTRWDDPIQRENYAMLLAAENAKQVGATHFIVVNAKQGGALGGGIMALTQPASAAQATTLIRVMTLERNAEPPMGALAADEIIHFFGPQFGREAPPPQYDPLPQAQDWPAAGAGR